MVCLLISEDEKNDIKETAQTRKGSKIRANNVSVMLEFVCELGALYVVKEF